MVIEEDNLGFLERCGGGLGNKKGSKKKESKKKKEQRKGRAEGGETEKPRYGNYGFI